MVHFTPEEISAYREKQEAKLSEEQKAQAKLEKEAHGKKRQALESTLKARFIAAGGKDTEWSRVKDRVVTDALVGATLEPVEEEPEKPRAPAPLSKRQYMN